MAIRMIANRVTQTATGAYSGGTISGIVTSGSADAVVTTAAAHGLSTGQTVTIAGVTTVAGLNATWTITVLSATTYSLNGSSALSGSPGVGSATVGITPLDISGLSAPWCIKTRIDAAPAGATPTVGVEDSVNAFSATVPRHNHTVQGTVPVEGVGFSVMNYDRPGIRFGTTSAVLRPNVLSLGGGASVTYSMWVES